MTEIEPRTERVPSAMLITEILGILTRDLVHELLGVNIPEWGHLNDDSKVACRKVGTTLYREGILKAAAMLGAARRDFLSGEKGAEEARIALDALGRMLSDEIADLGNRDCIVILLHSHMHTRPQRPVHAHG